MRIRYLLPLPIVAVLSCPASAAEPETMLGWSVPDWLNFHAQNTDIVQTTAHFPA